MTLCDDDDARYPPNLARYRLSDGTNEWTVGGARGTCELVDLDGTRYAEGHSLFFGQHNLEYFGEDEYMMFDNNFNVSTTDEFVGGAPSRLLIVNVDEARETATLEWELVLDDHTCIYGDNDRLPTGNLLGSSWPRVIDASADFQYDARIFEVKRDTKQVAFEAFVVGQRCTEPAHGSDGCVRTYKGGYPNGWSMYSVERFYEAPLVYALDCVRRGGATLLNVTTHDSFKMSSISPGSYKVFRHGENGAEGDAPLAQGDFTFAPHWRPTTLTIDLSHAFGDDDDDDGDGDDARDDGMVAITNKWGDQTRKHFSCRS